MFCSNCGKEIAEGASFCTNCGHQVSQNVAPQTPPVAPQTPPVAATPQTPPVAPQTPPVAPQTPPVTPQTPPVAAAAPAQPQQPKKSNVAVIFACVAVACVMILAVSTILLVKVKQENERKEEQYRIEEQARLEREEQARREQEERERIARERKEVYGPMVGTWKLRGVSKKGEWTELQSTEGVLTAAGIDILSELFFDESIGVLDMYTDVPQIYLKSDSVDLQEIGKGYFELELFDVGSVYKDGEMIAKMLEQETNGFYFYLSSSGDIVIKDSEDASTYSVFFRVN